EQWANAYERAQFRYSASNQRVGEATRDLFLSWFPVPKAVQRALRPAIYALLDDVLLEAFGFPRPPRSVRLLFAALLKTRAMALRFFLPPRRPLTTDEATYRSYPRGYTLNKDIGPDSMLAELNRASVEPGEP